MPLFPSLLILKYIPHHNEKRYIVHAISEQVRDFYLALGFDPSPLEPMTLMITLNDLKACIPQK